MTREAHSRAAVLDFYESAYRAGAEPAGWGVDEPARVDGANDRPAR